MESLRLITRCIRYQIYDSLQAFSSSIASLLSSRAVLSSVGVGDADASPTAALLLSIFQESVGRLATILFAHRFGMSFEPECKMYRLLADILNDTGFILDMISPVFPKPLRVVILSFSSVLRSLCGVAAGSAKASLSAHFAKWGNLGELNAKDSSQETVISLLGMWAGSLVVSWITSQTATWTALILLLSIHLETNRRAVRAVSMRKLNRQRATLVYHHLKRGHVPTPEEVSKQERIFERDGALRSKDDRIVGFCSVGASLSRLLDAVSEQHSTTKSSKLGGDELTKLLSVFETCPYILWHDKHSRPQSQSTFIVLKKGATPKDMLRAWWQSLELACDGRGEASDLDAKLAEARRTIGASSELLQTYERRLEEVGWDLTSSALEVVAGSRVAIEA